MSLLTLTENGLYCAAGDFHIDPWRPVERAVLTHAHGDHARAGSNRYLVAESGERVFRTRLGTDANLRALPYGEGITEGEVAVSLHPAGHILGSAQIRIEHRGEVWVVSGDYKTDPDSTCAPFAPLRCHTFITESTFGLPIYRWKPEREVFDEINAWWRNNQEAGRASVLFAYALGKAQRVLAGIDAGIGPICVHGAVARLNEDYRAHGVTLPDTCRTADFEKGTDWSRALIVAPPSANGTPWMRRFGDLSTGFVSGWMQLRGTRRRRAIDRGFVLSDHADWAGLNAAITATGAESVWVTHGSATALVRWLREKGLDAQAVSTRFEGEMDEAGGDAEVEA
jgi:putative mRNA 3-end processing factor